MQRKKDLTQRTIGDDQLKQMREELDVHRAKVHAAKIAYLNRAPFQGQEVTYEDLKRIATEYIGKSYDYQKAIYGEVRVKISVAKLLRQR